jgi:hypothetical protein
MALPSTGAISLSAIQTEFGGANPIAINEYYAGGVYVPAGTTGTNGAVPSSGTIDFNVFHGTAAGFTYWQQEQSSNTYFSLASVGFDSSDNYYSAMNGSTNGATFNKVASLGANQFTRRFTTGQYTRMVTTAAGNSYITGVSGTVGTIVKYNSSGVLQWQRSISCAGGSAYCEGICLDASENVYVGGWDQAGASMFIMSFTSAGTQRWVRNILPAVAPDARINLTSFASGTGIAYSFVVGSGSGGANQICAGTYDTAGVVIGQIALASPTRSLTNNYMGFTSLGSDFLFGFTTYNNSFTATYQEYLTYNTAIGWQKELNSGGLGNFVEAVSTDGTAYYSAGRSDSSTGPAFAKLNATTGSIIAQRYISGGPSTGTSGVTAGSTQLALGSQRYTVASYMYKAPLNMSFGLSTSLTSATSDFVAGTVTVTDSAGTQTSSTSTRTEAAFAGSYTLTQLT